MKDKYLVVKYLDFEKENDVILPIPLCCGIVKTDGNIIIPEQVRKWK